MLTIISLTAPNNVLSQTSDDVDHLTLDVLLFGPDNLIAEIKFFRSMRL